HRIEFTTVDFNLSRAQSARYAFGAFWVARPDAAGQAVDRVVGNAYGVVFIFVRDDRKHRAEDLFLGDGHFVLDVGEDGRANEITFRDSFRHLGAAGDKLRALFDALLNIIDNARALRGRDQRAELGLAFARIAHGKTFSRLLRDSDRLFITRSRHEHS